MTSPFFTKVYVSRISAMSLSYRNPQTFFRFRHCHYVNMIRHKAISPYFHTVLLTPFRHQTYVDLIIIIAEKSLLSTIPALCYMVRTIWRYDSCDSCHAIMIYPAQSIVKKMSMVSPDYAMTLAILAMR